MHVVVRSQFASHGNLMALQEEAYAPVLDELQALSQRMIGLVRPIAHMSIQPYSPAARTLCKLSFQLSTLCGNYR
jgi:hypothetical protein